MALAAGAVLDDVPWAFAGLVYRGQTFGSAAGFARYTAAAEVGAVFFGLELGYGRRERSGDADGVHVSPFIPIFGLVNVGPQFLIPVNGSPFRVELVASLKFGLIFHLLFSKQPVVGKHLFIGRNSAAAFAW